MRWGAALLLARACTVHSANPVTCRVEPALDRVEGWILGPNFHRVSTSRGVLDLPPQLPAGSWTVAFPGYAPASLDMRATDARCAPDPLVLAAPSKLVAGRVFGLPDGSIAEIVGCGGAARSLRTGHFEMPVLDEAPCYVEVIVDDVTRLSHVYVRNPAGVVELSIPRAVLGVDLASSSDPTVVTTHRTDGALDIGDRLVALDGRQVHDTRDVLAIVGAHRPGEWLDVEIDRGGRRVVVAVALIARLEDSKGVRYDQLLPD